MYSTIYNYRTAIKKAAVAAHHLPHSTTCKSNVNMIKVNRKSSHHFIPPKLNRNQTHVNVSFYTAIFEKHS